MNFIEVHCDKCRCAVM